MNPDMRPDSFEPGRGHKNILKMKVLKLWHQPSVCDNLRAAVHKPSGIELLQVGSSAACHGPTLFALGKPFSMSRMEITCKQCTTRKPGCSHILHLVHQTKLIKLKWPKVGLPSGVICHVLFHVTCKCLSYIKRDMSYLSSNHAVTCE